jgi:selenocysteine lyase/cysteine desulfurase
MHNRAHIVVDGVAYAPHRLLDVAGWGVDWYVMSIYK